MMKKTLMLAGMIAAGVALTSTSALADTQGTQTFTANIAANTCTLNNLDRVFNFNLIGSTNPGKYKTWTADTAEIKVTGCDSSVTELKVTPTYTHYFNAIQNQGTLGSNLYAELLNSIDNPTPPVVGSGSTGPVWSSGSEKTVDITNGEATMKYYVDVISSVDSKKLTGTLESTVSFLVDMQ
ncbi:type 1 fimbrial protein [Salmonella enterica]|nr:type 1 fimbrial protein [Salmonella enterica]